MLYLGLANIYGHEPAACVIENGKIISIAEEERFVNIKHADGLFPTRAVKFCLEQAGAKLSEVDKICHNWKVSKLTALRRVDIKHPGSIIGAIRYYHINNAGVARAIRRHLGIQPELHAVEHHIAHASSAYHLSGFNEANIITIDGSGERTCTLLAHGKNGEIEKLKEFYMPNSLGYLYTNFTEFLGFRPDSQEGTVMGLAPYGKPQYSFDDIVKLSEGNYHVDPYYTTSSGIYSEQFIKKFGNQVLGGLLDERHSNIAYALQDAIEKIVIHMARWMYNQTGCKNFCLAGGVALNCKMNGALLQQDFVDDIFVQPMSNDAGGCLGSAIYTATNDGFKFDKMEHTYYGPEFSDEKIEEVLKQAKVKYNYIDDITGTAAEMLDKQKIVGWFQGRMEEGPRALGNRSILADPRDKTMKDKINYYVKHREPFRPFCPSVLKEKAGDYIEGKQADSPFMILSFDVKKDRQEEISAVVHVDGSARTQDVDKKTNPVYYDLIEKFSKLSGVPVVLNTSFNDQGQPIVRAPDQALKMFFGTGMDALALGNYLIEKR